MRVVALLAEGTLFVAGVEPAHFRLDLGVTLRVILQVLRERGGGGGSLRRFRLEGARARGVQAGVVVVGNGCKVGCWRVPLAVLVGVWTWKNAFSGYILSRPVATWMGREC